MDKKYKYVHIFMDCEAGFASSFWNLLNASPSCNSREHLIVLQEPNNQFFPSNYFEGVIYEDYKNKIIRKYLNICEYLFIHNININDNPIYLKKREIRKIIWRTWGSDVSIIKNIYKNKKLPLFDKIHKPSYYYHWFIFTLNAYYKRHKLNVFSKNIKCIGVCNIIDILDIKIFLNSPFFIMNYSYLDYEEKKPSHDTEIFENNKYKILIGHSGYPDENHINIIKSLIMNKHFDKLSIFVPVSYGSKKYIKDVKSFCSYYNNIHIIDKMYDSKEWCWILNNIDYAIFDSTRSTGLGNISFLVKLKKTIFLNSDGIIAKGFKHEKIPYYSTETIPSFIFDKNHLLIYNAENSSICKPSKELIDKRYHDLFNYLNSASSK